MSALTHYLLLLAVVPAFAGCFATRKVDSLIVLEAIFEDVTSAHLAESGDVVLDGTLFRHHRGRPQEIVSSEVIELSLPATAVKAGISTYLEHTQITGLTLSNFDITISMDDKASGGEELVYRFYRYKTTKHLGAGTLDESDGSSIIDGFYVDGVNYAIDFSDTTIFMEHERIPRPRFRWLYALAVPFDIVTAPLVVLVDLFHPDGPDWRQEEGT